MCVYVFVDLGFYFSVCLSVCPSACAGCHFNALTNAAYQILITNLCIIIAQATTFVSHCRVVSQRQQQWEPLNRIDTLCTFITYLQKTANGRENFSRTFRLYLSPFALLLPYHVPFSFRYLPFELDKLKFNNSKRFIELISNVQTHVQTQTHTHTYLCIKSSSFVLFPI